MPDKPGHHFLQIPGPTPLPERIGRAIARSTIDHRGPEFAQLTLGIVERLQSVLGTTGRIAIYPSSATGAWEAALVNALSPGDRVLFCTSGQFAAQWSKVADRLGLDVAELNGDWRHAVDPDRVAAKLAADPTIAAVALVHNETSTGVLSSIAAVRQAIDQEGHSALLMVDAVSSLGAVDYRHDEWGVDVTVAGSQKGLMLPPGLGFNAIGERALAVAQGATLPRSYWDWTPLLAAMERGFFPYTPATNLLFGLDEALSMLLGEGLDQVFARHRRLARATRAAVAGWDLAVYCRDEKAHSPTLTAVLMPANHDADQLRRLILEHFDLSLGTGLGPVQGQLFRIGHLGSINDLMLCGALCGVEMGLDLAGVPHRPGGVQAALDLLAHD
ncbi:MAG: aminotransferase class V-fold PLP-dependent enzyme [Candidatus Latescibacterota bacterium]|nr:aminotransferase class V-fold PLP-dependent enzyme [Candidatus Latescibacterota bacterium]